MDWGRPDKIDPREVVEGDFLLLRSLSEQGDWSTTMIARAARSSFFGEDAEKLKRKR
jgi:hypothetical protein